MGAGIFSSFHCLWPHLGVKTTVHILENPAGLQCTNLRKCIKKRSVCVCVWRGGGVGWGNAFVLKQETVLLVSNILYV